MCSLKSYKMKSKVKRLNTFQKSEFKSMDSTHIFL